jgi:hypothetical protein
VASRDLFAPRAEEAIRNLLLDAKKQARARMRGENEKAIDFLENRQIEHVRGELSRRYQRTQAGGAGQVIEPVTVPLVERYIAEAADAYNRPVTRKVLGEDGAELEEQTKTLNEELDRAGYNERLHRVDQVNNLLGGCGLWFQAKRGMLRPVVAYPHQIHEVAPTSGEFMDPGDPEDYAGYVVEMHWAAHDSSKPEQGAFALLSPAEVTYYTSSMGDPFEGVEPASIRTYANPYRWPQVVDTDDQRGMEADLPLQMLTLWHKRMPVGCVVADTDSDITAANLELSVQLSVLLDTIRIQGWAMPVLKLTNPESAPANMSWGARFPLALALGEAAEMLTSNAPYAQIIEALNSFVKFLAIAHRQSPNDFSLNATAAASGFAKLVDSLPKLEARRERLARLKYIEERVAWPRIASILRYLGKPGFSGDVSKMHLSVEFADIEFPQSVDERARLEEHEIKHNLTTPAKILAKRKGIPIEEAEAEITENAERNGATQQQAAPAPFGRQLGQGLGTLIGRRSSSMPPQGATPGRMMEPPAKE